METILAYAVVAVGVAIIAWAFIRFELLKEKLLLITTDRISRKFGIVAGSVFLTLYCVASIWSELSAS